MRKTLDRYLAELDQDDIYLVHGDMWHFTEFQTKRPGNVINCGIQEPTVTNISAGLAWCGKTVFIYGVAGMIIHRAYEQLKLNVKGWGEKNGTIIIVNAGHNNCYLEAGRGHLIDDDDKLCHALNIPLHEPVDRYSFLNLIKQCMSTGPGVNFIRLGHDDGPWKIKE
jgi:transketolase C-terminal domain/subunit